MTTLQVGSGVTSVAAAAYSGLQILGTVGGALAGFAAVIALVLSVVAGNAKRRRQYEDDIRDAETRGRADVTDELTEARRERDDYQKRYLDLLERQSPPPRTRQTRRSEDT